jgi:hypothetical protein
MLIIFSLCALLTSLTLIGHYQLKIEKTVLQHDVEIDQIGEDFIANLKTDNPSTPFEGVHENYAYAANENILTVWHKDDQSKSVVLYVEAEIKGDKVNVLKWRYSLPQATE